MKIAIIHDWLVTFAGAERVLKELLEIFPDADLFSTVCFLSEEERAFLRGRSVKTTFIQKMPRAKQNYRSYLPLMPLAIEQLDLTGYDVVISSSYAVAKGVLTGPDQLHISYVHSPIRYAWDLQHAYLREARLDRGLKGAVARALLHYMRLWDVRTAHGVDRFVANSQFIARRIRKVYRRDATVIYPPVDTEAFTPEENKEDFYLTASRLVPYKCIPMIAQAFASMPERRLVVIGDGPEMPAVRARAGENVTILGYQPEAVLRDHMRRARAFVFAAEEDFGITPVEAQACGTPVIAYARGGTQETVRGLDHSHPTGLHFREQTCEAIVNAVEEFERNESRITPAACRQNALRFTARSFRENFSALVQREIAEFFGKSATDPQKNRIETSALIRSEAPFETQEM